MVNLANANIRPVVLKWFNILPDTVRKWQCENYSTYKTKRKTIAARGHTLPAVKTRWVVICAHHYKYRRVDEQYWSV